MIKVLLDSQERAYKTALDVVVKQMSERINKLETTVSDLTTSLEYTQQEVDDLKSKIKDYEKDEQNTKMNMEKLTKELDASNQKVHILEDRCNYQEDYSRRNNVRISGVGERSGGETWEQTASAVTFLCADKLQLPGLVLERAHRVGQRRDAGPRPIVARFTRYCDREAVMRNARKLRGTNIYINDDLCAASQAQRNAQMPQLKAARAQGKVAYFRHTRLVIKEKMNDQRDLEETASARGGARGEHAAAPVAGADGAGAPAAAAASLVIAGSGSEGARGEPYPPLPSPLEPATSTQRNQAKKNLRSSAKK